VQKYLGEHAYKRLILSHHKNLNDGHYLVDDRMKNGADKFKGMHIHFGTDDLQALGAWSDIRMVQRYGHLSAERVAMSAHNISSFAMEEMP